MQRHQTILTTPDHSTLMPLQILDAMSRHETPEAFIRGVIIPALKKGSVPGIKLPRTAPKHPQLNGTPPDPKTATYTIALVNAAQPHQFLRLTMEQTVYRDPRLIREYASEESLPKLVVSNAKALLGDAEWVEALEHYHTTEQEHDSPNNTKIPSASRVIWFPRNRVAHWPAARIHDSHRPIQPAAVTVEPETYAELAHVIKTLNFFNHYVNAVADPINRTRRIDAQTAEHLFQQHEDDPRTRAFAYNISQLARQLTDARIDGHRTATKSNAILPKVKKAMRDSGFEHWPALDAHARKIAELLSAMDPCNEMRALGKHAIETLTRPDAPARNYER